MLGDELPGHRRKMECLCCGYPFQGDLAICTDCRETMLVNTTFCCVCCIPLSSPGLCGSCQQQLPAYSRVYAPYIYGYPVDELVGQFKHQGNFAAGLVLTELMAAHLRATCEVLPDLIVPLPLHWRRQWHRGFNQSIWMAKKLSRKLNCPLNATLVKKVVQGKPQQSLPRKKRLKNIKGSFVCKGNLTGLRVALLDDVMTTGATVQEASLCLLKAGAQRVDVWCLARTPLER